MGQISGAYEWRLSNQRLAVQLRPSALRGIRKSPEGVLAGRRGVQDGKALILIDSASSKEPNRTGVSIVGYYRVASVHEPTREELARLTSLLGDSSGVFLLLHPQRGGLDGKLFYQYGGRILRESSNISIADERGVARRTWTIAAASVLVMLVVIGIATWYALNVQATNTEQTFHLTAHWDGPESRLRWNAGSLEGLPSANLLIKDGKITAQYLLSRRQIQEGSFSYTPRDGDVTFRLEGTDTRGHTFRESLVLARQLQPPQPPPEPIIRPQQRRHKSGRRSRTAGQVYSMQELAKARTSLESPPGARLGGA